mmetsp:Transcript_13001/g.31858  ORF Transcript_13001/g.31858 Transcript_13001/m.31858 type:complete len:98 (-) Transcript_13001:2355-2648(-)
MHTRTSVEFGSVVSSLVYPAWKRSETAIPEEVETPWESDVIQNSLEALYRASRHVKTRTNSYFLVTNDLALIVETVTRFVEIRGDDSEYAPKPLQAF